MHIPSLSTNINRAFGGGFTHLQIFRGRTDITICTHHGYQVYTYLRFPALTVFILPTVELILSHFFHAFSSTYNTFYLRLYDPALLMCQEPLFASL